MCTNFQTTYHQGGPILPSQIPSSSRDDSEFAFRDPYCILTSLRSILVFRSRYWNKRLEPIHARSTSKGRVSSRDVVELSIFCSRIYTEFTKSCMYAFIYPILAYQFFLTKICSSTVGEIRCSKLVTWIHCQLLLECVLTLTFLKVMELARLRASSI